MRNFVELNARNIVNLEEIDAFLKNLVEDIEEPEIIEWVQKSLKSYINNDYPRVSIVKKFIKTDPDWLKKSVEEGTALRAIIKDRIFNNNVNHIIDYFKSIENLSDISRLKFDKALERADKWTKDLNERAKIEEDFDGITVVREYPDDFKWVKVFSEQALNREGLLMRHCVGSYYTKVKSGKCTVYSLRNEENSPKCTVEVIKKEVKQIKGFANGPIQEKYVKYVKNFIEKPVKGENYEKVRESELQNIGILVQDGIWWNMYKLPKNFTVKSGLDFTGFETLEELPEGLTVEGILYLTGCTSLKSLPEGLTVKCELYLNNCTSLKSIPKDLIINSYLSLEGCTSLQNLPEGLIIKIGLNLNYCTSLKSLPEGLTVKGSLTLWGCTSLKSLPEGLTVEGRLTLKGTKIVSLPKNLKVERYIIVDETFPTKKYSMFKFKTKV